MNNAKYYFSLFALTTVVFMPLALHAERGGDRGFSREGDMRGPERENQATRDLERDAATNPNLRGNNNNGSTTVAPPSNNCYYDSTGAYVCV